MDIRKKVAVPPHADRDFSSAAIQCGHLFDEFSAPISHSSSPQPVPTATDIAPYRTNIAR